MRQIFVFTAGDKNARQHLNDSILNPVPFDWLREALDPELASYYQSIIDGNDGFYAWGAVPGPVNTRTWAAMQLGDLVLTVYDNQYRFLSSVVGKFRNPDLANRIWGKDDAGRTWEYMYLLSRPEPISVGVLTEPAANFLNKAYRGFTRISAAKVQAILQSDGSLDAFVQTVFHAAIPQTHVERELGVAQEQADKLDAFDPQNMADGRKKIIQEVVRRQGQPKFRKALLSAYGEKCVVSGCNVVDVLEAAHIAPYLGEQSNTVQNGLLLRADIHTLFDLGKLKITPAGEIELHETLLGTEYERYQGHEIRSPVNLAQAPNVKALTLKYGFVL